MRLRSALLAAVVLAGLAACAAPEERKVAAANTINIGPDQQRIIPAKVDAIAALVPEKVRAAGTLKVGLGAAGSGSPPLAFTATDNKTLIGRASCRERVCWIV